MSATPLVGSGHVSVEHLLDLLQPPAWHADALCKEHPEVNWFPSRGEPAAPAKLICRDCLVSTECRGWALAQGEELQGVWAGTSYRERRQLRAATGTSGSVRVTVLRARRQLTGTGEALVACGTEAGYRLHLRLRQQTCVECRSAHRDTVARATAARSRRALEPGPAAIGTGGAFGDDTEPGARSGPGTADRLGVLGAGVDRPPDPPPVPEPASGGDLAGAAHRLGGVLPVHPAEASAAVR